MHQWGATRNEAVIPNGIGYAKTERTEMQKELVLKHIENLDELNKFLFLKVEVSKALRDLKVLQKSVIKEGEQGVYSSTKAQRDTNHAKAHQNRKSYNSHLKIIKIVLDEL